MILLQPKNEIISETLERAFSKTKNEVISSTISDFDGVIFKIESSDSPYKVSISIQWSCYSELDKDGAKTILSREYGEILVSPKQGFNATIEIDIEKHQSNKDSVIKKAALFKYYAFSAPFEKHFNLQLSGSKGSTPSIINFRGDSSLYVSSETDRVTCVYCTKFNDKDDIIIGRLALQEFVDARKERNLQQAPQIQISHKEPPKELSGTRAKSGSDLSYITFVLFPRHYSGNAMANSISLLQSFRNYLHYHIKCSKAFLHARMRARVNSSIKILNRAKQDIETEKKTASHKTFVRK